MIPDGYTLETFTQFIQKEVFFEDTITLGLQDLIPSAAERTEELIFTGNGTGLMDTSVYPYQGVHVLPSPFVIEYLEEITLENGVVLQVWGGRKDWEPDTGLFGSFYGDTYMQVRVLSNPNNEHWRTGLAYRREATEAVDRVLNPIFEKIMNDALREMGLIDISQVNVSNMYMFRQYAILATIRTIMEGTTSMYPVAALDGSSQVAGTETTQLQFLYEVELSKLQYYLEASRIVQASGFRIAGETLSSETGIKVTW